MEGSLNSSQSQTDFLGFLSVCMWHPMVCRSVCVPVGAIAHRASLTAFDSCKLVPGYPLPSVVMAQT